MKFIKGMTFAPFIGKTFVTRCFTTPQEGTPPMKCYSDNTASYSLNEITIY